MVNRRWLKIGGGVAAGIVTILGFFGLLMTLYNFEITDLTGDFACAGTYEDPCISEFQVRNPNGYVVDIYSADQVKLDFSPGIKDYALFVPDGRCSATGSCACDLKDGSRIGFEDWRCVDFTNKTKPRDDRVYNFRFPAYSTTTFKLAGIKNNPNDNIKWGFGTNDVYLDPAWYGVERDIGYEFIDENNLPEGIEKLPNVTLPEVVHIWNTIDDYYFDKNSGMQFTNNYQDYWNKNIFCLGYDSAGTWVKIACVDELEDFNRQIDTDNQTYVNATLWKDFNYYGYDLRFGVQYHLGVNDTNLSVTTYIKNIGIDIPFDLGFAWKAQNISIPGLGEDYIDINGTSYMLNQSGTLTFTDMEVAEFNIHDITKFLKLGWDKNLNYETIISSDGNQENAYIMTIIDAGHFNPGQEKQTTFEWIDAATATVISTDDAEDVFVSPLGGNGNKLIAGFCEETADNLSYQVFYTNGTEISGHVLVDADIGFCGDRKLSISALNESHVAIAYYDSNTYDQRLAVWDVSSGTEIFNSNVDNNPGTADIGLGVSALNSTHFVHAYIAGSVEARVFDAEGNSITGPIVVDADPGPDPGVDVATFNSTHFVVAYIDDDTENISYAIYDVEANVIISPTNIDGFDGTDSIDVATFNSTHFVVAYRQDGSPDSPTATVYDIAGTEVVAPFEVYGVNTQSVAVSTIDYETFVVGFYDATSADNTFKIYNSEGGLVKNAVDVPGGVTGMDIHLKSRDQGSGIGFCTGSFAFAWQDSATETVFITYDSDGNLFDGECPLLGDILISEPTTASPASVTSGDNLTIVFNYSIEDVNVTTGVKLQNITIGNTYTSIWYKDGAEEKLVAGTAAATYSGVSAPGNTWCQKFSSDNFNGGYYPEYLTLQTYDLNGVGSLILGVHFYEDEEGLPGTEVGTSFNITLDAFYSSSYSVDISSSDAIISTENFWIGFEFFNLNANGPYILFDSSGVTDEVVLINETGTFTAEDKLIMILNVTLKDYEFEFLDNGWSANVSVPTFASGLKDLMINTTESGLSAGAIVSEAIDYGSTDSCTYTSGDWAVDCSDYCNITSTVNLGENSILIHGAGEFTVREWINNTDEIIKFGESCTIFIYSGGFT